MALWELALALAVVSLIRLSLALETSFCTGLSLHVTPESLELERKLAGGLRTRTRPLTGVLRGNRVSLHFPSLFFFTRDLVCWKTLCGSFKTSDVCN